MLTSPLHIDLIFSLAGGGDAASIIDGLPGCRRLGEERLAFTCFDTSGRALARAGMTLTVRRDGRRYVQTLAHEAGGCSPSLPHWRKETVLSRPEPELAFLPAYPRRLAAALREAVQPLFDIEGQRFIWRCGEGRGAVRLILTRGEIRQGAAVTPIIELEIVPAAGAHAAALALARRLSRVLPLDLRHGGLAMRGDEFADAALAPRSASGGPVLWSTMPVKAAFRLLAQDCLRQFLGAAAEFRAAPDPEAIHRMRVALRRFRTLLRLHRPLIDTDERARLRLHLGSVFAVLGVARNWDIVLAEAETIATGAPADLVERAQAARQLAYARVAAMLGSGRLRLQLLVLCGWLSDAGEEAGMPPLDRYAAKVLARQRRRLAAFGDIAGFGPRRLHRVRIEAKRLRYACEFFGSLFPLRRRAHRTGLAALRDLQAALGRINDLISAREIAATLMPQRGKGPRRRKTPRAKEAHRLRGKAAVALRKSLAAERFWI